MSNFGTVLRIKGKKAVVITGQSDFVMIKSRPDMFIGKGITFENDDIIKNTSNVFKYSSIAASIAAVFIIILAYTYSSAKPEVYAFIDIDINPSLELSIDKQGIVIEAKALNDDAREIIKHLKLTNKGLKIALSEVVGKSAEYGYLKHEKGEKILVSTSLNKDSRDRQQENEDKKLDSIVSSSNEYINQSNNNIVIYVVSIPSDVRDLAVRYNTSMGRYFIFEKAKESDASVTLDKVKASTVSKIVEMVHLNESKNGVSEITKSEKINKIASSAVKPKAGRK